jgi:hypothetical protein
LSYLEHFLNPGYGWICISCSEKANARGGRDAGRARFFSEGEAEEKEPRLSTPGLAKWRDASRQILYCPDCGVEERVSKS